jgi:serine phosphatase RsbU (regulator of sigma subunit)
MPSRIRLEIEKSTVLIRRWLGYALYDWTFKMAKSKRLVTRVAILIQGYAIWAGFSRSLIWPLMWPKSQYLLFLFVCLLYLLGDRVMNAILTSEFVRKTQLEADQIAARQIQKTLQPEKLEELVGYEMEVFYQPYRAVGGDYFDVIDLPGNRTLLAIADVSGKGMAAALLAANIQALVRSLVNAQAGLQALAGQINKHLCHYTPSNRFATAVFMVLNRDSGDLIFVNAGHNAPMVYGESSATPLGATGIPMGLRSNAEYEAGTAFIPFGGFLLIFTDGLTDSIPGNDTEGRLRDAMADNPVKTMSNLKSLIDPRFNEDDITILLLRRTEAPNLSAQ